jgi:NAD(P)-dependent dehydrogenase (short-subunit alcohol dehydrogenase family)
MKFSILRVDEALPDLRLRSMHNPEKKDSIIGKITEEHFDKLFGINVKGTLFTVQKALPLLKDGGSVILTGSVAGVKGTPALGV